VIAAGPALAPTPGFALAAGDFASADWAKLLVFLAIIVFSALKSRAEKAKQRAKQEAARAPAPTEEGERIQVVALPTRDRERVANAQALAAAVRADLRPPPRPATPQRPPAPPPRPARPARPARRAGLVADAHVDVSSRLPTADDMPGAHSARDHVHLTEIGADRGTSAKHPGASPTAAAAAPHETRRVPVTAKDLLRSTDLRGKQRLRAGVLWAEVFGPPRSRTIARGRR